MASTKGYYSDTYLASAGKPSVDPKGPSKAPVDQRHPWRAPERVVRGGDMHTPLVFLHPCFRHGTPETADYGTYGFRVARDP